MALLFDEADLAGAEGIGVVLQRTFAALVTDRAVQRVVDEQQLQDAVLGPVVGSVSVLTFISGVTGSMQLGWKAGPRPVSTSTRHMRHMPTGFMRGW